MFKNSSYLNTVFQNKDSPDFFYVFDEPIDRNKKTTERLIAFKNNEKQNSEKWSKNDLQRKLEMFGGMEEIQQDIIDEINRSTQRLDNLLVNIRKYVNLGKTVKSTTPLKDRRLNTSTYSVSPCQSQLKTSKITQKTNQKKVQPSQMRLKDRVEKQLLKQEQTQVPNHIKTRYIK